MLQNTHQVHGTERKELSFPRARQLNVAQNRLVYCHYRRTADCGTDILVLKNRKPNLVKHWTCPKSLLHLDLWTRDEGGSASSATKVPMARGGSDLRLKDTNKMWPHKQQTRWRSKTSAILTSTEDNDNDNTLKEVPHPSNDGLALKQKCRDHGTTKKNPFYW